MCVASIADEIDDFEFDSGEARAEQAVRDIVEQRERERERAELQRNLAQPPTPSAALQLASAMHYEGVITGPEDIAGNYAIGDACEVWVGPNESLDGQLNCRWYVDCGKRPRRIYGGGDVGFSTCELDADGFPLRAQDEDDDGPDGAFVAELGGPQPMVMVLDRWLEQPTRLVISIVGEGEPHAGRIPNVRLADRLGREQIEAAIARNEYPSFAGAQELPDKLSSADIQPVMRRVKPALGACGGASGAKISAKIKVLSDGHVDDVQLSPPQPPQVASCLSDAILGLQFPAFGGDKLVFTYRFEL